jgi:hypothetical protein
MIILDTDHLSVLEYPESAEGARLTERMEQSQDEAFVTTAVSLEEQMRAWLAAIHRTPNFTIRLLITSDLWAWSIFTAGWKFCLSMN